MFEAIFILLLIMEFFEDVQKKTIFEVTDNGY